MEYLATWRKQNMIFLIKPIACRHLPKHAHMLLVQAVRFTHTQKYQTQANIANYPPMHPLPHKQIFSNPWTIPVPYNCALLWGSLLLMVGEVYNFVGTLKHPSIFILLLLLLIAFPSFIVNNQLQLPASYFFQKALFEWLSRPLYVIIHLKQVDIIHLYAFCLNPES